MKLAKRETKEPDELTDEQLCELDQAILDAEKGEYITWEELKREMKSWRLSNSSQSGNN